MMRRFFPVLALLSALPVLYTCGESAKTVPDTLTVSPASLSFSAEDVSVKLLSIATAGGWTASASDSWIHLNQTSGTGKATLNVTADTNDGADRTGAVTVSGAETVRVGVTQAGKNAVTLVADPDAFDGTKRSSTTYQLLVYSFADSDGDGIGDFKGIQNKLDYLDGLGATALWLSPIHPSDSYHGYDVTDYCTVNPAFGTEEDFKDLVDAAHARNIKIYIDYVLNHSGKGHPWFVDALSDASSPYRDYYFFSANPSADYSSFPMLSGTSYQSGEWKQAVTGSPKLTVKATDEAVATGSSTWNLWTWPQAGGDGKATKFVDNGSGTLYQVMDINGTLGMLVRKYDNWNAGSKFGAKSQTTLTQDTPLDLVADGADIYFTGNGRYRIEVSDYSTETLYYMAAFSDWMPDLNYGAIADVENNATFRDLAASADKWIALGVDGFRLDAVKHICGGIGSYNNAANRKFLKAWYDHCNASYKAAGHSDDIFMVGECWDNHSSVEKYYYEGITSCFEFGYWPVLCRALNTGNASSYVSTVAGFVADHLAVRADAQTSLFMTNHDDSSQSGGGQLRASDDLGRDLAKEKQAAAMMLTSPGKPFVYQGEELGYWGNTSDGSDEYLRAPIVWNAGATDVAKGWTSKLDNTMLKGSISVETQSADGNSLLNVYKTWNRLRNTYPALAEGTMTDAGLDGGSSVAAWYMTAASGQKLLVIHNTASSAKTVTVKDDTSHPVAVLGTVTLDHTTLSLGANASVVFAL